MILQTVKYLVVQHDAFYIEIEYIIMLFIIVAEHLRAQTLHIVTSNVFMELLNIMQAYICTHLWKVWCIY